MTMRIEVAAAFEQTDENEYTLVLYADEGDLRLTMPTDVAVLLFEAVESGIGDYVATMRSVRAAFARATPEERAQILGLAIKDAQVDPLEQADMLRDRMRSK